MSISRRFLLGVGWLPLLVREPLSACGDKLLHFRGGLRFQRAFAAARKASILIYLGQDRSVSALKEVEFQSTLKQVGHRVTVVEDPAGLDRVLRSSKFDLVLSGLGDAMTLTDRVKTASTKPLLIPAMYKPAKRDFKAAKSQYSFLLRLPSSPARSLTVIDRAMKSRFSQG